MLALRLSPELEKRLEDLATRTGRSQSDHAEQALLAYLEDLEDATMARQALEEGGPRISLEDVMKTYGVNQGH